MNYATDLEWHRELLALLAERMSPRFYLELGVHVGGTMEVIVPLVDLAVGVDVSGSVHVDGYRFYKMTTTQFLRDVLPGLPPVELAFVDADHSHDAVKADLLGLWPHMAEDGLVVLHDTYPRDESDTGSRLCGDAWRVAGELHAMGMEAVTLPFPPGVTICRRTPEGRHLRWAA